jgi:signal transduction histidine kinase
LNVEAKNKNVPLIGCWGAAAYLCVFLSPVLAVAVTAWGVWLDCREVRVTLLKAEVSRIRSHLIRTAGRIQDQLGKSGNDLPKTLAGGGWLRAHWGTPAVDRSRRYAAIVDAQGTIVFHSDRRREGGRLPQDWYTREVAETGPIVPDGDPVVETNCAALTGGGPAFDIRVPILQRGVEIASCHGGLEAGWFYEKLSEKYAARRWRWSGILLGTMAIVVVTCVSLYQITRRTLLLRRTIAGTRIEQLVALTDLAARVASKIRRPVEVIRYKLETLQRLPLVLDGDRRETCPLLAAANQEVDRLCAVIRAMLNFAVPGQPHTENVDLRSELEATVNSARPMIERSGARVLCHLPPVPVYARIDRYRFRQILLNLLVDSGKGGGPHGSLEVVLARRARRRLEIIVCDAATPLATGRCVPEPQHADGQRGTGLGPVLARRFVEEANGEMSCESDHGGRRFRVVLPEVAGDHPLHRAGKWTPMAKACHRGTAG